MCEPNVGPASARDPDPQKEPDRITAKSACGGESGETARSEYAWTFALDFEVRGPEIDLTLPGFLNWAKNRRPGIFCHARLSSKSTQSPQMKILLPT